MAKKARLQFSPLERLYNDTFGQFPDYHFTSLMKKGYTAEESGAIVQGNIDKLWKTEKSKDAGNGFVFVTKENEKEIPF